MLESKLLCSAWPAASIAKLLGSLKPQADQREGTIRAGLRGGRDPSRRRAAAAGPRVRASIVVAARRSRANGRRRARGVVVRARRVGVVRVPLDDRIDLN